MLPRRSRVQVVESVLQERQRLELFQARDQLERRAGQVRVRREIEFDQIWKRLHERFDACIRETAIRDGQAPETLKTGEVTNHLVVETAAVEDMKRMQIGEPAEQDHIVRSDVRAVWNGDMSQSSGIVETVFSSFAEPFEPLLGGSNVRRGGPRCLRRSRGGRGLCPGEPASCGEQ